MVTPVELNDLVASRVTPGQADGRHHGLCTGADKPYFFNISVVFNDQFGEFVFQGCGGAEAEAFFERFGDLFTDLRAIVRECERAPGSAIVHGLTANCVPQVATVTAFAIQAVALYIFPRADRRLHASRKLY